MSTYGGGTKIAGAINVAGNVIYTVPANCYAIIHGVNIVGSNSLSVGGGSGTTTTGQGITSGLTGAIYVGPGQTIEAIGSGCSLTGVLFSN